MRKMAVALLLSLCVEGNSADTRESGATVRPTRHPFMLCTSSELELARNRVRDEAWAKRVFAEIAASARQLEQEELPVFDRDWWKVASAKRWQDIYPEVHQHAGGGVDRPLRRLPDAAIAYAISGEPRHAETVRKVLLHYANYEFEARHPDVGMNWAGWGIAGLQAYDLVFHTLSDQDRKTIDGLFDRAFAAVMQNDRDWVRENYGGRFNNHYAHHKLFIGAYGLFYGKREQVDYAVNSEQGFQELVENGGLDDGLWFESSLNYHFTGVGPIGHFAALLRRTGDDFDLWNHAFKKDRRLRDFFVAPAETLFPDETLPTVGDTYGRRAGYKSSGQICFEAYDAIADPRLGWLLRDAEPPGPALFLKRLPIGKDPPPGMKTRVWPEHGYVALRSQEGTDYWKGDGFSAFVSFDRDSIHSHRDKFGMTVYGRGAHLAIDPEATASVLHAFSSKIQRELNRETICHNTIMVDGRNHAGTAETLRLVSMTETNDCKMATISDDKQRVYPGVRLSRTVTVTPDYVLDVFQAASDAEHTYDYLFHSYDDRGKFDIVLAPFQGAGDATHRYDHVFHSNDDRGQSGSAAGFEPVDLGTQPPWNWLRNASQASINSPWAAMARQGNLNARLSVAAERGTRVITCDFPRNDTFAEPPIPMLIARRAARSTVFVSVLQAERGELPSLSISVTREADRSLRIRVDCGRKVRTFDCYWNQLRVAQ